MPSACTHAQAHWAGGEGGWGALGHSEYVFKWFIQVLAEAICTGKQELMLEFGGRGPNSQPGWDGASLMEA